VKQRVLAVLFCLLAAGAAAQETPDPPAADGRRPREEAFRMIDAYLVSNLQESLGLTDEQFVRVLPMVKRLQNDRRQYAQRRQRGLHELRRLLQAGGATEGRVEELLREVKAVENEGPAALRRDLEAIDGVLSPLQQAKFRILELEVERKIREIMNQMRGPGRAPGRGRPRSEDPSARP
jgi:Spy/CpxP family protein refolding chaperone